MKNFAGFEINPKSAHSFVDGIGKYMINFGTIEILTYLYIEILSHDEVVYDLSMNMTLSRRLDLINKLAEKRYPGSEITVDIKQITEKAKHLSTFRNNIAHNPLMLGQTNDGSNDTVAFIGIPKWKKSLDRSAVPMISAKNILLGVDAVVELAKNMNATLEQLKEMPNGT